MDDIDKSDRKGLTVLHGTSLLATAQSDRADVAHTCGPGVRARLFF